VTELAIFCQQIAPDFKWAPINSHMRVKFSLLEEGDFQTRYRELLKFLYLRSKYGKGFIPVTVEVDAMWHEFILQTQAYFDLCAALPGKHFIHHNTVSLGEYTDLRSREEVITDLLDWIPHYVKTFGPFTEDAAKYWMIVTFLREEINLSLEAVNKL
jgi:hypothetical protein